MSRYESQEAILDDCIDRLLDGEDWQQRLPADDETRREVARLMTVASRLLAFAVRAPQPDSAQKARVKAQAVPRQSLIRRVAFYRLPYLPPLWIRPEKAC